MIDWDAVVLKPVIGTLGEPATYRPATGAAFAITVVFDSGFTGVDAGGLVVTSTSPRVGVRLAEFPASFDAERAQGDRLTITRTGVNYVVKEGRPDSHGGARLDLNRVP